MHIYLKYILFHGWIHIDRSEFPIGETSSSGVPFFALDPKINERVHYMCVRIETPLSNTEKALAYVQEFISEKLKVYFKENPENHLEFIAREIAKEMLGINDTVKK